MEILQLTTDKPEFSNFIGDTLVLKEDSKVCLNKASFSIPVMVNRNIYTPVGFIVGDYTYAFFNVVINGVQNSITYQEFYDAYDAIDGVSSPSIDTFYAGYNIWCDNLPLLEKVGSNDVDEIPTFTDILAKACSTKFAFYNFYVENIYDNANLGQGDQVVDFVFSGDSYNRARDLRNVKTYGLTAMYEPRKRTVVTPSAINWNATDTDNFNVAGDRIESADANPSMAACPVIFDRNGGYIKATPAVGAGKLCMGLVFVSSGHADPVRVSGVYEPENFDVGIEWEKLTPSNDMVLRIIDGNEKFVYWDSATNAEVETVKPNFVPPNQILSFDHAGDTFWFIVRGGRSMNGTTEFTTTIVQGPGPNIEDDNNRVIYVAKTKLNSSAIRINTLAYSLGAANVLDDWAFIEVSDDTKNEDDYLNNLVLDNWDGIKSSETFAIIPQTDGELNDYEGVREFWNSVGIGYDTNEVNCITTTLGNGYNKRLNWQPPGNMSKTYWIGANGLGQIAYVSGDSLVFNIAAEYRVTDIPREINLSLLDSTINPRTGSAVLQNGFFDTGSFSKVVNAVQTDKEDLYIEETQTLDYSYEAYNLVYRKLENKQPLPLTQFKAKIGFKNFRSNQEVIIPKIEGIGKFELLFD